MNGQQQQMIIGSPSLPEDVNEETETETSEITTASDALVNTDQGM